MWRRVSAATLLPLFPLATACTAVRPVSSPAAFIAEKGPDRVWVNQADSGVWVERPSIKRDTLVGTVFGDPIAIPLSSVQTMRARQAAKGTTALVLGGFTVAGAVLAVIALNSHGPAKTFCDPASQSCSNPGVPTP